MQEMRIKVNQIELQIQTYEKEGGAIIFLHFGGANLMMWQRAIPYFQDRYRLVMVDMRGHGKSDRPESGYHIDEMAGDIIGVMKRLKIERAHIVGSSMGAEVGLSLAANYPEKVISLVCDGALSNEFGPYGTWEGSQVEFEEHIAGQLEKLRDTVKSSFPSVDALIAARRKIFEGIGWWNEYVEAVERYGAFQTDEGKYTHGMAKEALLGYMQHYYHYNFEDYYRRVRCPLLMLPGEDVLENEREMAAVKGLAALAEGARIEVVSGWEHPYGWMLNPKGVSEAICKFLGQEWH